MDPKHAEIIRKNMVYLGRNLEVNDDVLNIMNSEKIFTWEQVEQMRLQMGQQTSSKVATSFLMLLKRRGPNAFGVFLKALKETEQSEILKKLDEGGSAQPLPSVFSKYTKSKNSYDDDLLKLTITPVDTKDPFFSTVLQQPNMYYKIGNKARSRVIILNNKSFSDGSKREGAYYDYVNMLELCSNLKLSGPILWKDFTGEKITSEVLKEVTNCEVYSGIDLFLMVLMSHGSRRCIYGTDMTPVDIQEQVIAEFQKMPQLKGVPKIFIIQACRNDPKQKTEEVEEVKRIPDVCGDKSQDRLDTRLVNYPSYSQKDTLVVYATAEGGKAFRNKDIGSIFIRAFIKEVAEYAHCRHLEEIITQMTRSISDSVTSQICETECTLERKLFLLPGYNPQDS